MKIIKQCDCKDCSTDPCDCEDDDPRYCLRVFSISVELPSNPFGDLAGTYFMDNETGFGAPYLNGSCDQLSGGNNDVLIFIQTNDHPWVGQYFDVLVYSDLGQVSYGWAWTKGMEQIVDEPNCSGHCLGEFVGAYSDSFFHIHQGKQWIKSAPGSFRVPHVRTWGLYGERLNEFSAPIYNMNPGQCYFQCYHDQYGFNDPEVMPAVQVNWNLNEGLFPKVPKILHPLHS